MSAEHGFLRVEMCGTKGVMPGLHSKLLAIQFVYAKSPAGTFATSSLNLLYHGLVSQ